MVTRGLILALLMLVAQAVSIAGASARPQPFIEMILETQEAFLGDSVIVEVRWSGLTDPVDFSPLNRDADIVRETAGTRIAVMQGEVVEIASRRIELLPRRIGRLTLGPLQSGGVASNQVAIDITEAVTRDWAPGPDDIRLEQRVSEANPYVQQQLVLDIELRTRHPIFDETVTLPALDGFRAIPIFEQRRTLDEADGGWSLIAWRYLLFPQHSGLISIAGIKVSGTAAKSRAERGRFDLAAPETKLDVRPSAFGAGAWWVAARELRLRDHWSVDPTKLSAGDEVERTITVEAVGMMPEQIPDVEPGETRGLTITRLGVDRNVKIVDDVALATADFRYRVRALSPVPVFLDTVRVRWWNTMENHADDAIIPARRIDIAVPDRAALVDAALSRESAWDRMLAAAGRMETLLALTFAALLAAVVLAIARAGAFQRMVDLLVVSRQRRHIMQLANAGNASGLHEQLRRLSREQGRRVRLLPALTLLEEQMFGRPVAVGLKHVARLAGAALMRERRPASTLPQL